MAPLEIKALPREGRIELRHTGEKAVTLRKDDLIDVVKWILESLDVKVGKDQLKQLGQWDRAGGFVSAVFTNDVQTGIITYGEPRGVPVCTSVAFERSETRAILIRILEAGAQLK